MDKKQLEALTDAVLADPQERCLLVTAREAALIYTYCSSAALVVGPADVAANQRLMDKSKKMIRSLTVERG